MAGSLEPGTQPVGEIFHHQHDREDREDDRRGVAVLEEVEGNLQLLANAAGADEAEDGQYAVEAMAAERYDVMFLDLSMPRMSGEEVVRWLRAHPDVAPGLRIVVVSAWAGDKRPTLHELGVDAVLPKPFRKQQLLDLLEELAQPR